MSVDPTTNNSMYSYHGKGFLQGECGININDVQSHDIGKWHCSSKIIDINPQEYTTVITLTTEKGNLREKSNILSILRPF